MNTQKITLKQFVNRSKEQREQIESLDITDTDITDTRYCSICALSECDHGVNKYTEDELYTLTEVEQEGLCNICGLPQYAAYLG